MHFSGFGGDFRCKRASVGAVFAVFLAALTLFLAPLCAQIITASLQGTVQDSSGAVVSGASVEVTNTSTGIVNRTKTDNNGRFVVTSLAPGGPYQITVQAPGFQTEVRAGITLAVNQIAEVPIKLQVGAASQKVEVVADASQLDTSTAAIGQVIGNRDVENLPLNQRNVYALMFLMPGVTGTVTAQYNGLNMSVNGGRPGSTNILVDGIPATPPLVNPIGGFSVFPSVDSVQEFKVESSNYSAEFGRSGSGIVNVILKSGTNQFHGSLFEFLRNSDLDANTYFANAKGQKLPHFERSQFGGSLTGPILRNRSFFLFSYEGLRQGTQTEVTTTVPTALQRAGDFSQTSNLVSGVCQPVIIYDPATTVKSGSGYTRSAFPGNVIPSSNPNRIDAVAAKIVNYYPLPNQAGDACTGNNNFFAAGVTKLDINTVDARVDQVINDRNRFFVRYSRRGLNQPPNLLFPKQYQIAEGGNSQPQAANSASIDYTFAPNPNLVIEIPVGFSRMLINFVPISIGFNPTAELGFPSYIADNADHLLFPTIAAANYYSLGDGAAGQGRKGAFQIFTVGANATKILGNHVLKFGGTGWLLQANDSETGASTGLFNFTQALTQGPNPNAASPVAGNAIASLLLGLGSAGNMTIDSKIADTSSRYYGLYVQDDWKVSSKLSLNLGLRYDLEIPRTERHNRMETFNPVIPSPLAGTTGLTGLKGGVVFSAVNGTSRRQFSPQWSNFGPRFGFSYALTSNTEIRGAYGIYYGPSIRAAGATVGNEGFSAVTTYAGSADGLTPSTYLSNPFPNGVNTPVGNSLGLLTGIGSSFENPMTGDNKVPYTENWDFDIQRQLPWNLLVDAAYVGSHGVHLNKSGENDWNANQLTPDTLALGSQLQTKVTNPFYGIITTGPEAAATIPQSFLDAPFPQFTAIYLSYLGGGYEDYSSFQLKVNKRLTHNLSALVSFTGGKQIDDYSIISNVGHNAGGIQNIYNQQAERSLSSNDISRNLVISGVYNLPFGRGQAIGTHWNRGLNAVAGGWQLNGILTEQDGFPLAVTTQNTSQSGSNVLRPNLTGTSPKVSGSVKSRLNGYLNAAAFSQPAPFTFGNAPRTLSNVRGPGFHNVDFSMFKNFQPTERVSVQFRVEAFNALNQVVFGLPNTVLTSGQFGKITTLANTPRQVQGAIKILF